MNILPINLQRFKIITVSPKNNKKSICNKNTINTKCL